jgi:hypothetical protein
VMVVILKTRVKYEKVPGIVRVIGAVPIMSQTVTLVVSRH